MTHHTCTTAHASNQTTSTDSTREKDRATQSSATFQVSRSHNKQMQEEKLHVDLTTTFSLVTGTYFELGSNPCSHHTYTQGLRISVINCSTEVVAIFLEAPALRGGSKKHSQTIG
eukprot:scpid106037/ scgid25513/ 